MKKLIVIFVMLISMIGIAQDKEYSFLTVGGGFDLRNAVWKGSVNDRAVNFQIRFMYQDLRDKDNKWNDELGIYWERFERLNFDAFVGTFNKVYHPLDKLELAAGLGAGLIHRWNGLLFKAKNSDTYFWTYETNAGIRYYLYDNIRVGLQFNLRRRTDIDKFVTSGFVNLDIKL